MSYNVYRVSYVGVPLDHHAIFVEKNADGSGEVAHVKGNIQNGMQFEIKSGKRPELSATFASKKFIGTVSHADYPRIKQVCETIEPPKKQYNLSKRINRNEPLRRCKEWTNEAVDKLVEEAVVKK